MPALQLCVIVSRSVGGSLLSYEDDCSACRMLLDHRRHEDEDAIEDYEMHWHTTERMTCDS